MNSFFSLNPETLTVLAQAAEGAQPQEAPFLLSLLPWLFFAGLIYFLFIRPISKQRKEQEALIATVKVGAKITTVGGIVGIITSVKDKTVMMRSGDSKLEIQKEKIGVVDSGDAKDGKNSGKDTSVLKDSDDEDIDDAFEDDEADAGSNSDDNNNSGGKSPYNRSRRRRGSRR